MLADVFRFMILFTLVLLVLQKEIKMLTAFGHKGLDWTNGGNKMCNFRKYPYLPQGRDFFLRPPPPWIFQLSFIHFFKFFGLIEPPTPEEIPIPSVGGVWIFSGTEQYVFILTWDRYISVLFKIVQNSHIQSAYDFITYHPQLSYWTTG